MDVETYIKQMRKKKTSYENIKNSLLSANWDPNIIENAISIAKASEIKKNGFTLLTIILGAIIILAITINIKPDVKTQAKIQLDDVVDIGRASNPQEIITQVDKNIDPQDLHISVLSASDRFDEKGNPNPRKRFDPRKIYFYFTVKNLETEIYDGKYSSMFYVDIVVINPKLEIDEQKSKLVTTIQTDNFNTSGIKNINATVSINFNENDTKGKYTIIIKVTDLNTEQTTAKAMEIEIV